MIKTDIVFVVLIYRNYLDLQDLCESLKANIIGAYEVLVVDSFCNDRISALIRDYSRKLSCHYIQIENKGYGYGNNRGIDFVENNFDYKYICVCNPDTMLTTKLEVNNLADHAECMAPDIVARKGKHQNPYWAYENPVAEWLIYRGYKKDDRFKLWLGIGINKIIRSVFNIFWRKRSTNINIYACHGSFFILSKRFIQESKFRFDESMFLFCEEAVLAFKVKEYGGKIKYNKSIVVHHKEDGSMSLAEINEFPHLKKSFLHYYENYRKR